jgi:hypothetical protein
MGDLVHQFRLDGTTPAWVWLLVGVETVVLLGALLIAGMKRHRPAVDRKARVVTGLLVAGLLFAMVVLAFFMIGTYEGSTAFAADRLGWKDWRKIIPWGSLDAGAMTFSLFAIRAVLLERDPRRALRIVFCLAGLSALLQLTQGGSGHHWQAGIFLSALAMLGSLVLHGIADQIQPSDEAIDAHRKSPSFGIRWMTDLPGTLCAWLAWHNYPPAADIERTVADGLENLRRVRADKLARLLARPAAPRWAVIFPRRYGRKMRAALAAEAARTAELTAALDLSAQTVQTLRADLETLTVQAARADAVQAELHGTVQTVQALRAQAEQMAAQLAEQTLRADTEQAARLAAEQDVQTLRARAAATPNGNSGSPAGRTYRAATSANGKPAGVATVEAAVGTLDDTIADGLWPAYRAGMEQTGTPMSRYRVEQDGACRSRQAERVLTLLANRWAAQTGVQTGVQVPEQTGAQGAAQTQRADDNDQEDSSARAV